jgi:CheY-like chemotaxis protein
VLDWMMPEMDGVEVCRRVRQLADSSYRYLVILTAKGQKEDIVAGLEAGADDYLTKPFNPQELHSRLRTGERILNLEADLAGKVQELQDALDHVKTLQGLLPICMHCKKIRDEGDVWHKIESYISDHSGAMFTHSLCDECLAKHYPSKKRSGQAPESG